MQNPAKPKTASSRSSVPLKGFVALLATLWTIAIVCSWAWNNHQENEGVLEVARAEARTAHQKDVIYRRWNAGHGGVYVPKTEQTPSNEYLDVPEKEITTPSGRILTMVNPAYMTRQAHELAAELFGVQGHITSLKPIRPANMADEWESVALGKFEQGLTEFSSVEQVDGEPYMRLIRPLMTEQGCLACHASQGYKIGDVRGGISVAVPMAPVYAVAAKKRKTLATAHGLLWALGICGLFVASRRIQQRVRERDQAEAELQRAQKLEAMGQLAGGLAHEINSPIQYIQDNIQFFSESLEDIFEALDNVDGVENGSDLDYLRSEMPQAIESSSEGLTRIATIVRAMIDISRPGCAEMQQTDVNELIANSITVSRSSWGDVAELETDLDPEYPLLSCIPGEFSQAILNLIFNASDAIERIRIAEPGRQGKIRISTRVDGDWAEIRVSDNGQGISPEIRHRIYDPFFTTKDVGQGTGQGLMMIHGLVTETHGGTISFETEEGVGTTFIVRLPIPVSTRDPVLES